MAWLEKTYKIVLLKHGLGQSFEVFHGDFESEEDAITYLKEFSPERPSQYIIVPMVIFKPDN